MIWIVLDNMQKSGSLLITDKMQQFGQDAMIWIKRNILLKDLGAFGKILNLRSLFKSKRMKEFQRQQKKFPRFSTQDLQLFALIATQLLSQLI